MILMIKDQKSREINNMSIKYYHREDQMSKVNFIPVNSTSTRDIVDLSIMQ